MTAPANLSQAERAILDAVTDGTARNNRADKRRDLNSGISLGDLEIETGYEGDDLKRTLALLIEKGLIHPRSQPAGHPSYSKMMLTKYYKGPAQAKARAA
jgi:hypothetical protein